jgi:tetratricopeptide (TPR) repeat protein
MFRLFITLTTLSLLIFSQENAPLNHNEKKLNESINNWVRMWNNYNLDTVDELFLNNKTLSYFSSEKEGILIGIDDVRKHHSSFGFVSKGKKNTTKLWLDLKKINYFTNSALVSAIWFFQKPDGTLQKGPVTIVYSLEENNYKIAHMNFSNYEKTKLFEIKKNNIQTISLLGDTLYSSTPYEKVEKNYLLKKIEYENQPDDPEKLIWYGRWAAYNGDYRTAINLFSKGIEKFPKDARFYRHRGHRLITLRLFDDAISDFEKATKLRIGKKDQIEPDGMPNAQNIPVSTLHSNISYHLGLAYYLKGDLYNALRVYRSALEEPSNNDNIVSISHWLYMTLMRLDMKSEAKKVINKIDKNMKIIENTAYHKLCLFYKGDINISELSEGDFSSISNEAIRYGIANWNYYNGEEKKAKELIEILLRKKAWASFGYIAAESDYTRNFR